MACSGFRRHKRPPISFARVRASERPQGEAKLLIPGLALLVRPAGGFRASAGPKIDFGGRELGRRSLTGIRQMTLRF
jgi:hypothetical protein